MAITLYCSETDLEVVLSPFGVTVRADDDGGDDRDTGVVTSCLQKAAADINQVLLQEYSIATLLQSTWVKWCTANFAAVNLCRRRGNPIPQSLLDEVTRFWEELRAMRDGIAQLTIDSGLAPPKFDNSPAVSNMTIDSRYGRSKVRRVDSTSTGGPQADGRIQNNVHDFVTWML